MQIIAKLQFNDLSHCFQPKFHHRHKSLEDSLDLLAQLIGVVVKGGNLILSIRSLSGVLRDVSELGMPRLSSVTRVIQELIQLVIMICVIEG